MNKLQKILKQFCKKSCRLWKTTHLKFYKVFLRIVGLSEDKTSRNLFRLFQVAIYAIVIILVTNIYSLSSQKSPNFGAFGDFFGGMLNPILMFLTFMGLLITIILQQKELRLTRKEIKISSSALLDQASTLNKQRFEDTFFSMLDQHNKILSDLCNTEKKIYSAGWSDIQYVREQCFSKPHETLSQVKTRLEKYNSKVSHYFRTLYQLLKLVATKHPDSKVGMEFDVGRLLEIPVTRDEKYYSNIVRSYLNYETTQILAVNCYFDDEDDSFYSFYQLIVRYEFLEHMPFNIKNEVNPALIEAIEFYGKRAFGKNIFAKKISPSL